MLCETAVRIRSLRTHTQFYYQFIFLTDNRLLATQQILGAATNDGQFGTIDEWNVCLVSGRIDGWMDVDVAADIFLGWFSLIGN